MDFAGRMVVHSESKDSAFDVERMRTRIWAIIRQAVLVGVFALSLEFYSRYNSLLCGADMMKHSKIAVLAYSLARTTRTSRIVAVSRRKGAVSPTLGLVRVSSYLRARELKI